MVKLIPFTSQDFDALISWVDSEELLVTIAGPVFSYPLTTDQLEKYLQDEKSHSFTVVDTDNNKKIGHAELVVMGDDMVKIDKLIIGDKTNRGKGIGQQVMELLLEYSFMKMSAQIVELNVFEQNVAGIRCYEKCGFVRNPDKQAYFPMGENNWLALNMSIDKQEWKTRNSNATLSSA